jgi:hypothetical protein
MYLKNLIKMFKADSIERGLTRAVTGHLNRATALVTASLEIVPSKLEK